MWIKQAINQQFMYDYRLSNDAAGERSRTKEISLLSGLSERRLQA
jgi:hypothetical protein